MIFYQQIYLNRLVVFGSYELLLRLTVLDVSLIVCHIISKKTDISNYFKLRI